MGRSSGGPRPTDAPPPWSGRILSSVGIGAGTMGQEPADRDRIAERIRVLRARVYGRDPRPEDVAALTAALAEQVAARPAPATAHRLDVPAETSPPPAGTPRAATHGVVALAAASARAVPPRVLLTGVAVAVIAALAGAAGLLIVEHPVAADADPAAPRTTAAVSVAADPALLDHAARSVDRSTALVGPDLVRSSFRRLAAYPAAGVTIWAARDRFGETCLVAVDTYYRTACADAATLDAAGLVLQWSAGPGFPASTTESYTAVWRDGRLVAGRSAA